MSDRLYDVAVVGAGFGGLGAALTLAEAGADVAILEALKYPGGCASTFTKGGYAFDAGATLLSGLGEGQVFAKWLSKYGPDVDIEWIDPLVELRAPSFRLETRRERTHLVRTLDMLRADGGKVSKFFAFQERIAGILWPLFEDPTLLPPLDAKALLRHAQRGLDYLPLLGLVGRTLESVLEEYGVADLPPLRAWVDSVCQITVQCGSREAEAPFALAAMDYFYRGTAHVRGGVGKVADALVEGCRANGADIRMSDAVWSIARQTDGTFLLETRKGPLRARQVIANLVPRALERLVRDGRALDPGLSKLGDAVELGWGAAMLYLGVKAPPGATPHAHHLELIADPEAPLVEGNHLFVSTSGESEQGRAPAGLRAVTVSTHVPLRTLRKVEREGKAGEYVEQVQMAMKRTFAALAPEWWDGRKRLYTASPRTFARFTGRPRGAVGGVPRTAGLGAYFGSGPYEPMDGVFLVGDSVFPGQSALATAVGGARTAVTVGKRLGARRIA